jgi:hypothetical protein
MILKYGDCTGKGRCSGFEVFTAVTMGSYRSLKVSDLGWAEKLGGQGIYWFLMYISKINQWCQYNDLKIFLMFFVMWLTVLIFIIVYLNSLYSSGMWCRVMNPRFAIS